jgi:BlaI family penicillinase repressor
MAKAPAISEAEWDVMKVVWDHEPVAASDVAERLAAERDWHPQTVKTMLALTYKPEGKRYLYRAKISRDACARHESRSFLSRVFDGSVTPAVVHLLTHSKLSDDELKQLRRILDGGGNGDNTGGK